MWRQVNGEEDAEGAELEESEHEDLSGHVAEELSPDVVAENEVVL